MIQSTSSNSEVQTVFKIISFLMKALSSLTVNSFIFHILIILGHVWWLCIFFLNWMCSGDKIPLIKQFPGPNTQKLWLKKPVVHNQASMNLSIRWLYFQSYILKDKRCRTKRFTSHLSNWGGNIPFLIFLKWKSLSPVWLLATPGTAAHQAPLSMEFSRPEYWRGWLSASPGDLPNPGNEPRSPTLQILYCLSHQRSPIFLRNLLNTMENAEASMFNANSGFCSKCSHKLCFTSNVNVIWCDMRSVEVRAAIRVEDERYWQQYVPCHSFLTSIFFLKNNFWTCIIRCDFFFYTFILEYSLLYPFSPKLPSYPCVMILLSAEKL